VVRWDARILALCLESVHGCRPWASVAAEALAVGQEWLRPRALLRLAVGLVVAVELAAACPVGPAEAASAGPVWANLDVARLAAVLLVSAWPELARRFPVREQQEASQPPVHSEKPAQVALVWVSRVLQPQEQERSNLEQTEMVSLVAQPAEFPSEDARLAL
jgi:hypothetical protein